MINLLRCQGLKKDSSSAYIAFATHALNEKVLVYNSAGKLRFSLYKKIYLVKVLT
jgi:hypothetical protein